jgi:hypothetical protein
MFFNYIYISKERFLEEVDIFLFSSASVTFKENPNIDDSANRISTNNSITSLSEAAPDDHKQDLFN